MTGEVEPWDATSGYYSAALLVAGFVAALVFPARFWIAPVGVYVGQFSYAFAALPLGPLWPLGLLIGIAYSLLALLGATLAFVLVYVPLTILFCRPPKGGDTPQTRG